MGNKQVKAQEILDIIAIFEKNDKELKEMQEIINEERKKLLEERERERRKIEFAEIHKI